MGERDYVSNATRYPDGDDDYCCDHCGAPSCAGDCHMGMRAHFWTAVRAEIDYAYAKHGRDPWGSHEFYAILREEVDELWDAVKRDAPMQDILAETVKVAAMCLRYVETGDRYRGAHPSIRRRRRAAPPTGGTEPT